jgi:hypothetical protein
MNSKISWKMRKQVGIQQPQIRKLLKYFEKIQQISSHNVFPVKCLTLGIILQISIENLINFLQKALKVKINK